MKLFIVNNVPYHYEILESIIHNYNLIIKNNIKCIIYMKLIDNEGIKIYLEKKYPHIIFENPAIYDFFIDCTLNHKDILNILKKDSSKFFYINHDVTQKLNALQNVFTICPFSKQWFYADILPLLENKIKTETPVYIIQGNFIPMRRNFLLIEKILKETYDKPFIIKVLGRSIDMNFVNKYKDKFILKQALGFEDYHKQFSDAYCIIPLILKKSHPQYYTTKMTSSINYARRYRLKCLIDRDLQSIYGLNDVEVFNNENDIIIAFKKTLYDFYK
jgi:hypothetical protein